MCPLCSGAGFVQAAKVESFNGFDGPTAYVGHFHPVPCWACFPLNLEVLA